VEEREEEKERKWAVNLQPAYAKEPRKFVRQVDHAIIVKDSTTI